MIYEVQKGTFKKRINIIELQFNGEKGEREGKWPAQRIQRESKERVCGYSPRF